MASPLLEVKDLHTFYRTRTNEEVYAVSGVSLSLEEGRITGIAGESGCGKSTLALSLMGFYFPPLHFASGAIELRGTDIMKLPYEELRVQFLGREIAYIPQAAMNALNPTRRIIRFIEDVIREHLPGEPRDSIRDLAFARFKTLNLPERVLSSYPNELSGGMKQRTVIAISTILNPAVLIADEPTSALDVSSQKVVIRMLLDLLERGFVKSMIFITHELPLLRHVADDVMVMYAGRIVEKGRVEEVIFRPLHPYTNALMGSIIVAEADIKGRALVAMPGAPPNLKQRIRGCAFADRCPHVRPECREHAIDPVRLDGRMYRCIHSAATLREYYGRADQQ